MTIHKNDDTKNLEIPPKNLGGTFEKQGKTQRFRLI